MMKIGFDLSLNFALKQSGGTTTYLIFENSAEGMVVLGEDR